MMARHVLPHAARPARWIAAAVIGLAVVAGTPRDAAAEGAKYAVIVQGASGEEQYATLHRGWATSLATLLRDRFKLDPAHLTVLVEQPGPGEERSTAESVKAVLGRLAKQLKADDLLFVMLIGHGGGDGTDAKFNLVGPDLTIAEWNALVKPIRSRIAFVDATSSSFAFLKGLAAPGRVVITATNSYAQRYHTVFPDAFIQALGAEAADADKNNRISLLEAFTHASRLVGQHYEQKGTMATERAMLDDTGDGVGRDATATGPDGTIASLTYLDTLELPKAADPDVQKLLLRQRALNDQLDELRRQQPVLPASVYEKEFEKVMVELAEVSREIRKRTGGK